MTTYWAVTVYKTDGTSETTYTMDSATGRQIADKIGLNAAARDDVAYVTVEPVTRKPQEGGQR
jgi:hypothetical protein